MSKSASSKPQAARRGWHAPSQAASNDSSAGWTLLVVLALGLVALFVVALGSGTG